MTNNHISAWSELLQNDAKATDHASLGNLNPESVIEALQQMANSDSVTGFTEPVVDVGGESQRSDSDVGCRST